MGWLGWVCNSVDWVGLGGENMTHVYVSGDRKVTAGLVESNDSLPPGL